MLPTRSSCHPASIVSSEYWLVRLTKRQDSRDMDGDSEMASSMDSVHTDSDGACNGAHTPTNAQVISEAAASELSPPGSQSQNI